jgi:hypothetical protein
LPSPWAGTVTAVAVANGASSKLVVTDGTDTVEVTGDAGSGAIAAFSAIDPDLLAGAVNMNVYDDALTDAEIDATIAYNSKYL